MISDKNLGWLAGFIDGEGTISIAVSKKENRLHAQFFLTNTDLSSLEKARDLMLEMGVETPHLRFHAIYQSKFSFKSNVPCHRVFVGTALGIKLLLNSVLPELTAKRKQAELMLAFLDKRMGRSARVRFTERDFEIAAELSKTNRRKPGSQETTRKAPNPAGDDIVRPAWRHAEDGRNDHPPQDNVA